MSDATTFDPGKYLTKVGGSDYLEVKWRLVWLRDTHPDASIETELVSHQDQFAIFRARVSIPDRGTATGWGSEGYSDFRDYIEKAETKAIGRALAALGFGTQFCPDFDFGAGGGRVVDSPIDYASTKGRRAASAAANEQRISKLNEGATTRQLEFIEAIARELGTASSAVAEEAQERYGRSLKELSRRDASNFIELLQSRRVKSAGLAS